jgi:enoyl-CoA hydratase
LEFTTMNLDVESGIARVTLTRPEQLNTMNRAFWTEMVSVFKEIDALSEVRCVVIDALGRHFTAGLDLNDFGGDLTGGDVEPARRAEQMRRMVLTMQETFSVIDRCRMPVLAAIQGGCIGGGVDLASACDMRYVTADAFFTIQEINIAITADVGTLQRIPYLLPQGVVREMAYTGRRMPAQEAFQRGLANQVYDTQHDMQEAVMEIAREIASKSPVAMTGTKEMLNYARDHSIADGLNYVATWNAAMLSAADLAEAFRARMEKREPAFDDLLPARKIE